MRQSSNAIVPADSGAAGNMETGEVREPGQASGDRVQRIAVSADLAKRFQLRQPVRKCRQPIICEIEHAQSVSSGFFAGLSCRTLRLISGFASAWPRRTASPRTSAKNRSSMIAVFRATVLPVLFL